jgi:hypothetical protein
VNVAASLLAKWQQRNAVQVVVVGGQGAIAGKKYWVEDKTPSGLRGSQRNWQRRQIRQEIGSSASEGSNFQ